LSVPHPDSTVGHSIPWSGAANNLPDVPDPVTSK
jgi:hypothetical protein